jgi:hypothetical protein
VRINVTSLHIAAGSPKRSCSCPLAYAFEAALPGFKAAVAQNNTVVWKGKINKRIPLPPVAKEFLQAFDLGKEVQPFHFDIPDIGEMNDATEAKS